MNEHRYVAVEENGKIQLSRDGDAIGDATWKNDQLIYNSTVLSDDVVHALEKKIKERMDANWDED
jgi:hypothetical protein